MTTENQLLPCPFCGCELRLESNRDWHRLQGDHGTGCPFEGRDETLMSPATDEQLALLYRNWNARAALAPPAQAAEGGEAFDWPDRAVLSVMNQVGDGPYGEEDVKVTRHFLKIADEVRAQFAQPASQEPCSGPLCGLPEFGGNCHPLCNRASQEQAQQPSGGEVVGYRVSVPGEPELGHWFSEDPLLEGYKVEPLCVATKQEPMTDEQLCQALGIDGADDWTYEVRDAVERHHGITSTSTKEPQR